MFCVYLLKMPSRRTECMEKEQLSSYAKRKWKTQLYCTTNLVK